MKHIVKMFRGEGSREGLIEMSMKHKILSWNVRGLNEGDKRLRIRNL